MKIKILFLAANPLHTDPLRLDEEVRSIDQAIRQGEFRDRYEFLPHMAVRQDDLQELLLRHKPHIVHFSGHGSSAGEIMLQNADGSSAPVSSEVISNLFDLLTDNVRCVVLNACYSQPQAEAIAEHIDAVIGIPNTIENQAAIKFSAAFYRALAYGRDVKTAFGLGCNESGIFDLADQDAPQLVALRIDPAKVTVTTEAWLDPGQYPWLLLATASFFVLLYYLILILFRFAEIDAEFLSFAVSIVTLLTAVVGLLGLTMGRSREAFVDAWEKIATRFPALQHTRNIAILVVVLSVTTAITFYVGLPALAEWYNSSGIAALEAGQKSNARSTFRRATRLAPHVAKYHYNLGFVYELFPGDSELSSDEYQRTIALDDKFWPAYNNLGRAYLDSGQNSHEALTILLDALSIIEEQKLNSVMSLLAEGVLRKNIGWAYINEGSPNAALNSLQRATRTLEELEDKAESKGLAWIYLADVYRLLADAYEAAGQEKEAQQACLNSEGFALAVLAVPDDQYCIEYGSIFCRDAQKLADTAAECSTTLSGGE